MNTTGALLFAKRRDIVPDIHAQFRCAPKGCPALLPASGCCGTGAGSNWVDPARGRLLASLVLILVHRLCCRCCCCVPPPPAGARLWQRSIWRWRWGCQLSGASPSMPPLTGTSETSESVVVCNALLGSWCKQLQQLHHLLQSASSFGLLCHVSAPTHSDTHTLPCAGWLDGCWRVASRPSHTSPFSRPAPPPAWRAPAPRPTRTPPWPRPWAQAAAAGDSALCAAAHRRGAPTRCGLHRGAEGRAPELVRSLCLPILSPLVPLLPTRTPHLHPPTSHSSHRSHTSSLPPAPSL